ncbi:MAG: phospholipase D-like domain-containing protein [Dehalococcoidia bacterium]|nr:phospholipase D-like domain-containing protein [Dehalococcoidia bacterium]
MRVSLLNQPNGPDRLGNVLIRLMDELPQWTSFAAAVAFVKSSGVRHLTPSLRSLVERHTNIRLIVGIDHRGSSQEGLQSLMQAVSPTGSVWVFHNANPSTYHPKVFLFEKQGRAALVVGSGNLSEGGLFSNYEVGLLVELATTQPEEAALLHQVNDMLNALLADGRVVQRLDEALLERLVTLRMIVAEGAAQDDDEERQRREAPVASPDSPFHRVAVRPAPRVAQEATDRSRRQPFEPQAAPVPQGERHPVEPAERRNDALVAEVPAGGSRWNQVNFDIGTFEGYFGATVGVSQTFTFRHVNAGGTLANPEMRPTVSVRSRNFRFELGAAAGLEYPANGRPVVVFLRRGPREFLYRLVMPGHRDHPPLDRFLREHWTGREDRMRRIVVSSDVLRQAWPAAPFAR